MAFYIDEAAGRIVEVVDGAVPDPAWFVIDSDTAAICGVKSGQSVSRDQIAALRDGDVAGYLSLSAGTKTSDPVVSAAPATAIAPPTTVPDLAQKVSLPPPSGWFIAAAVTAVMGWIGAAATTLAKYGEAQEMINDAWDISAIQVQQLNGEVAAHGITALIVAMAITVPAMLLKR